MNKFIVFLLCLLFNACAALEEPELADGRCNSTEDCKQGTECVNSFCEDLYFPRRLIKTH